ncbi:MAG: hypothetical protein ACTHMC_09825 [Pseudobacter sp.]|uniref:hypothetical protein n=1 Tax=Pseudobacter sp. TaxID=2045420 RepID=UPI003F8080BC
MSIQESNKLIAEFMGIDSQKHPQLGEIYISPVDGVSQCFYLMYDTSWSWLMPVIEKIEEYANVTIKVGICTISRKFMDERAFAKETGIDQSDVPLISEYNEYGFIGNVYHAVVDFIRFYNSQPSNTK